MVKTVQRFYEFGPFRVDTMKRRLLRDGYIVPLTPKAFDTLLVLIENWGQVVEKDDLMEKVWPGIAVEENNLTQNVSALRKALGERRDEPQYILTVSGLGYRFIASVNETWPDEVELRQGAMGKSAPVITDVTQQAKTEPIIEERTQAEQPTRAHTSIEPLHKAVEPLAAHTPNPSSLSAVERAAIAGRQGRKVLIVSILIALIILAGGYYLLSRRAKQTATAANSQIKSIAILPFKSLGSEAADEYIGLGMADALITKLSSIRQITVRPTSSILKYKNAEDPSAAARELGVDSVLDGHVLKDGNNIRVTVQLLRTSDGTSLWGKTFDEKYTDIFAVEDRISEEVMQSLLPTLTDTQKQQLTKHYTEDTEAYQSYIKGRYYWNKRTAADIRKAISYYEDAILEDTNYALAYAGLADSYATLGILDDVSPQETMPKARSAAMKALELDDGLAEAHAALAYVRHRYEWDFAGAEREFKRAIELNPQYATVHQWYGWYLTSLGKFDDAISEFQRAQQLDPLSLYANLTLGAPYYYKGDYDKAIAQYQRVVEMSQDFWLAHWWLFQCYTQEKRYNDALAEAQKGARLRGENINSFPVVGYLYAVSGKQTEARQALEEAEREEKQHYISSYSVALIYVGLGETDKAFERLEKAMKERDNGLVFLNIEHRFDPLRSDPRFAELVKEVGLPQ
jgi:DNA-binding winged helix-turn-helix (wHTH) protein/TolB-like protein/Tfp pilus assembly protein PilF